MIQNGMSMLTERKTIISKYSNLWITPKILTPLDTKINI